MLIVFSLGICYSSESSSHFSPWEIFSKIYNCWLMLHVVLIQVPLFSILKKFDGETVTEVVRPRVARMKYRVTKLPPYIIFHMVRFKKNNFFKEKNPTLGELICNGIKKFFNCYLRAVAFMELKTCFYDLHSQLSGEKSGIEGLHTIAYT